MRRVEKSGTDATKIIYARVNGIRAVYNVHKIEIEKLNYADLECANRVSSHLHLGLEQR